MEASKDSAQSAEFVIKHSEDWVLNGKREREPLMYARWLGESTPGILSVDAQVAPGPRKVLDEALQKNLGDAKWQEAFLQGLGSSLTSRN